MIIIVYLWYSIYKYREYSILEVCTVAFNSDCSHIFWFQRFFNMRHLKFVLVLAIAVNVWECGDSKFGEKGEISPRRRRCYDGSMPKRLKKRERKLSVDSGASSGEVCHRLYPRVSCCPTRRAAYQIVHRRDARVCWARCILSLWELSVS